MGFKSLLVLLFLSFKFINVFCRQNILLIVVDDLRPALGCYGDKKARTPFIDDFAKESVVFTRAYAQQALCAPSRNSLLTSRRPDTLHLYDFYSYWREAAGNFTTLPQYFKENGYITKSIGKVFHKGISSNFNDDQPYSWTETPYHPPTEDFKNAAVCPDPGTGKLRNNLICPVDPKLQPGGTLPDIESVFEAKKFIVQSRELSKPFFLAVGLQKPHVPLKYPRWFLDFHPLENMTIPENRYRPYGMPMVAWNPWNDIRKRHDIASLNLTFPFERMPDEWTKLITQSYYAAVTYIDELIGQMLLSLKLQGLQNNTIVALIGDHGWSLGEHSEWSKFSNYDVALNVPFILHVPQYKEYQMRTLTSVSKLVELVDLFPTLADLAGLNKIHQCPINSEKTPLCSEGTSLVPLINNLYGIGNMKQIRWKDAAFSQYPRPGLYPTVTPDSDRPRLKDIKIMGYSIRTDQYRYTEWVHFKPFSPDWSTVYATELYDHLIDAGENLNLADRPGLDHIKHELRKKLRDGWRNSLPSAF